MGGYGSSSTLIFFASLKECLHLAKEKKGKKRMPSLGSHTPFLGWTPSYLADLLRQVRWFSITRYWSSLTIASPRLLFSSCWNVAQLWRELCFLSVSTAHSVALK